MGSSLGLSAADRASSNIPRTVYDPQALPSLLLLLTLRQVINELGGNNRHQHIFGFISSGSVISMDTSRLARGTESWYLLKELQQERSGFLDDLAEFIKRSARSIMPKQGDDFTPDQSRL